MRYQTRLMTEWNKGTLNIPLGDIRKIDYNFPNTTVTCLPIPAIVARYYFKNKLYDEGLKIIHDNIEISSYIGVNEFEIARHYYSKENYDSALKYSRIALSKLPNNDLHFGFYTENLAKVKDTVGLENLFNQKVEKSNRKSFWENYVIARFKIFNTSDSILKKRTLYASEKFDSRVLDDLNKIFSLDGTGVSNYNFMLTEAQKLFDEGNYNKALEFYKILRDVDPNNYIHLENMGICYFMMDKNKEALDVFLNVLKRFKLENGKSKFYIGVIYYIKNEKENACNFLSQSLIDGYSLAKNYYNKICI